MRIDRHLFEGFKYAVFVIIFYSITLALSTSWILPEVVPNTIYWIIIPVLTAGIAHSITPKILILPGLLLGLYFTQVNVGFFGGIFGGLILGFTGFLLSTKLSIQSPVYSILIGYILIAGLSFGITYTIMRFLINPPILHFLDWVRLMIESISPTNTILLVGILSFLTVLDLGGPFNKLAYTFVLSFYLDGFYGITGPVLLSVALPPMIIFTALKLYPKRFTESDHKTSKLALFGALFGMTEGALAVTVRRPLRILPALLIGSVTASVLASVSGLQNILMLTSILGVFGVNQPLRYLLLHIIGLVGGLLILFFTLPKQQLHKSIDRV